MKKMAHQNIIKLYDVFEDKLFLYIVMERCVGGELFARIQAQPTGAYSEKEASSVLRQITEGLRYMHAKNIAHCDLKPDNFLFTETGQNADLKIIDFGMSKFAKRREYFKNICGTPYYVAPEVIDGHYTKDCDMWSLGVVMFVMLFGYPPFYADPEEHGDLADSVIFSLVKAGFKPVTTDGYGAYFPVAIPASDSAKDLIAKLLNLDPAKRLTAGEALEHPWLMGSTASSTPIVTKVINNLKTFHASCQFKQKLLTMMTEDNMTDAELEALKEVFQELDENGDGRLTSAELQKAITMQKSGLKMSQAEIKQLIDLADVNKDGALSYDELVLTSVNRRLCNKEERLWAAFCKLDLNGDGRLSPEEIEIAMGENSAAAKRLIAEADLDGDGTVDYDEFISMWSEDLESAAAVHK